MTTVKTLGNYAKTLLATLTGDETEKLALHNERRAGSAIARQLSSLADRKTTLQEKVEDAEEAVKLAEYPLTKLEEDNRYCQNIVNADERLDKAKADLADCEASIAYFEAKKVKLSL